MRVIAATILAVFIASNAFAAQISVAKVNAAPGSSVNAEVQYAAQSSAITGVQFDLSYDASKLAITGTVGYAGINAGKSLTTSDISTGKKRFIVVGLNQNTLSDGVIVMLNISVAAASVIRSSFWRGRCRWRFPGRWCSRSWDSPRSTYIARSD